MRVSPELGNATWRKSSYSNTENAGCVEVADGSPSIVPVRDSKNPHGPTLAISAPAWTAFVEAIKSGR
ncbi:DUF397 domain-containing protein [Streptomyces sp. NPDC001339]|uniref:DUF397 domain-containing protein n=1 Tax=Streptomyces sp. NPDC001339 TaxID=3364563 RepID=UPI0036AD6120